MTFTELHDQVGGDVRSFRRRLEHFEAAGLLWFATFGTVPGRGRPAGLWTLPPDAGDAIRRGFVGAGPAPSVGAAETGSVLRSQTWVSITIDLHELDALADLMSSGDLAAPATFVAQLDGAARQYVFAFDGSVGAQPAENLIHACLAAGLRVLSGTVRHVGTPVTTLDLLRTARQAAALASATTGVTQTAHT